MNPKLKTLTDILKLEFKNTELIENAFVHRSYLNESKRFPESNERLEYLGDAVLELATTEFLYQKYPAYQEGMLTNLRAALVRTETLAEVAKKLNFNLHLYMSRGEESTGGRMNTSILANCTEAFLGAVYLDQGYEACVSILEQFLFPKITGILAKSAYKDNKSRMQEIAQSRFKSTPHYQLEAESGPDHSKVFTVSAYIGTEKYGTGTGKSKQEAQEAAAKATLELIGNP